MKAKPRNALRAVTASMSRQTARGFLKAGIALFMSVPGPRITAAELPQLVLPSGVGVNIHFTRGHEKDLDLIAAAGFKCIRMDFEWAGTERIKGQYDWSAYEELLGNLERRGVRALFILDYSNPLYEKKITSKNPITGEQHETIASPQNAESIAGFARWAGAAAGHFKERHVIWEIWNEPNIHFWSPEPNVDQYSALALAACKEIRKSDPQATIVGPATSGFPWEFLEGCFKAGLLEYWDAASVHPYRDYKKGPETAAVDFRKLSELIARYAPSGKAIPILSGEWGYATHTRGLSLELQAAYAARQQLANLAQRVPLSIWYDWKNDGPDPAEREHNFGTVQQNLEPKPAYVALKTLTRQLSGCRFERRIPTGKDEDYVLLMVDETGGLRLAAWTTGGEGRSVLIELDLAQGAKPSGTQSDGTPFSPGLENGRLRLELSTSPQYIRFSRR